MLAHYLSARMFFTTAKAEGITDTWGLKPTAASAAAPPLNPSVQAA
jgi:hypothetical protein